MKANKQNVDMQKYKLFWDCKAWCIHSQKHKSKMNAHIMQYGEGCVYLKSP